MWATLGCYVCVRKCVCVCICVYCLLKCVYVVCFT
jgi:hypothetical protein